MIQVNMFGRLPRGMHSDVPQKVARAVGRALTLRKRYELGLRFVSEREIENLNRRYRGVRRPTDVLAFGSEFLENASPRTSGQSVHELGDVIIAPAYARREARRRSIDVSEELLRLMIHGMLHLFGFDHANERDEAQMFKIQEDLLARCIKRETTV